MNGKKKANGKRTVEINENVTKGLEAYAKENELTIEEAIERACRVFSGFKEDEATIERGNAEDAAIRRTLSVGRVYDGLTPTNGERRLEHLKILLAAQGFRDTHSVAHAVTLPLDKDSLNGHFPKALAKTLADHKEELSDRDLESCIFEGLCGEATDTRILEYCADMHRDQAVPVEETLDFSHYEHRWAVALDANTRDVIEGEAKRRGTSISSVIQERLAPMVKAG